MSGSSFIGGRSFSVLDVISLSSVHSVRSCLCPKAIFERWKTARGCEVGQPANGDSEKSSRCEIQTSVVVSLC